MEFPPAHEKDRPVDFTGSPCFELSESCNQSCPPPLLADEGEDWVDALFRVSDRDDMHTSTCELDLFAEVESRKPQRTDRKPDPNAVLGFDSCCPRQSVWDCRNEREQTNERLHQQVEVLGRSVLEKTRENFLLLRKNAELESKNRAVEAECARLKLHLREVLLKEPSKVRMPLDLREELRDHVQAIRQVLKSSTVAPPPVGFLQKLVSSVSDVTLQLVLLAGECNYADNSVWNSELDPCISAAQGVAMQRLLESYQSEIKTLRKERDELSLKNHDGTLPRQPWTSGTAINSALVKNNLRKELNCFTALIPTLLTNILTPTQAAHLVVGSFPATVNPVAFLERMSNQGKGLCRVDSDCMAGASWQCCAK